jgi:hypothetical protein
MIPIKLVTTAEGKKTTPGNDSDDPKACLLEMQGTRKG